MDVKEPEAHGDQVVRLDYPYADIWLHSSSEPEKRWRARACAKEPWTVDWIRARITKDDVLYDIGANVGAFALIAARGCGAQVVAFEPGYANFARLCENIQLNDCAERVIPVPLPLSDKAGLVGFKYRSTEPGQSRHEMHEEEWTRKDRSRGSKYVQPVCATTLDSALAEFRLPPPNHLKIDVDGAEARVLRGAATTLRRHELRSILIEIDAAEWDVVSGLLAQAGFVVGSQAVRSGKAGAPMYAVFERHVTS